MMENKIEKLITALEVERAKFESWGKDTEDHDLAIEYLKTGKSDVPDYKYEILDACRYDLDTICSDYK